MKKFFSFLLIIIILLLSFTGCFQKNDISNYDEVPNIVKKTNGGEKWQTLIDYENKENWLAINDFDKSIDVIYFYPTTFKKHETDAPEISDINDETMRKNAQIILDMQTSIFEDECNIYAPYYRQVSESYALTINRKDADDLFRYSASQDPTRALDYYFEHYNNGKPFILAGHSQGSQIITMILSEYMKKHPEHYKKMVAAYVIGYSVTKQYLNENPHLKFATGANDIGVIISYNTEGPGNKNAFNAVVNEGAISINPINWKVDDTYADVSENKGSFIMNEFVEGMADARVDLKRGVIICESVDPSIYAINGPESQFFGPESYHLYDYNFYYFNLRENVKQRIAAFNKKS